MSRAAVDQLLYLIDQAFEKNGEHSLLRNLESVAKDGWLSIPPGGSRSVRQIVGHAGACKFMYENFAFADATDLERPRSRCRASMEELQSMPNLPREPSRDAVLDWLREGQRRWRDNVDRWSDSDLLLPRLRPEGGTKETRWIIGVMLSMTSTMRVKSTTCAR